MNTSVGFGAVPLSKGHRARHVGTDRLDPPAVGHRMLADGGVKLILPPSGVLSDAEARQLAWALLADLAPDDVVPIASVVTYREAQRLAVLRVLNASAKSSRHIAETLGWGMRTVQRRLDELADDDRVIRKRGGNRGWFYSLKIGD